MEQELKQRWATKRNAIYNLRDNLERLKRRVKIDLHSPDEKDRITALIIRTMLNTSERIGNEESASNGHFGITQFKKDHIKVVGSRIRLNYVGKSGVEHEKDFSDLICAQLLKKLRIRNNEFIFTTEDGFRIRPDRVNRYLKRFNVKSKDIRGFNANRMMVLELNRIGKVREEKERSKLFNQALRKIAEKIGHGAPTLRKHYLLPEIEENFYKTGSVGRVKID
jgi:DNA topoisomerase-1